MDKSTDFLHKNPVTAQTPPDLDVLREWLRQPLRVTHANRVRFETGHRMEEEVVTTNRLILVVRGELDYTVEGARRRIPEGTQFLVSAWTRRVWTTPRARACEIAWCEFEDQREAAPLEAPPRRLISKADLPLELASYRRLQKIWRDEAGGRELHLEAELKALLARFWLAREISAPIDATTTLPHPRVRACLKWMNDHLHEPRALDEAYEVSGLTKNYFRELFQAAMGCSPSEHLQRLRLRRARYLLWQTQKPVKEVAYEVGYSDPLYFSRLYLRFWGRGPSSERRR